MHHLIPKLMPIDITEALSGRSLSQLGQEPSRCVPPGRQERTEARGLVSTVEWTLIRAMAVADSSLRLGGRFLELYPSSRRGGNSVTSSLQKKTDRIRLRESRSARCLEADRLSES